MREYSRILFLISVFLVSCTTKGPALPDNQDQEENKIETIESVHDTESVPDQEMGKEEKSMKLQMLGISLNFRLVCGLKHGTIQ